MNHLDAIYQDWTEHMNGEQQQDKKKQKKERKQINKIWFAVKIGLIGFLLGAMVGGLL